MTSYRPTFLIWQCWRTCVVLVAEPIIDRSATRGEELADVIGQRTSGHVMDDRFGLIVFDRWLDSHVNIT